MFGNTDANNTSLTEQQQTSVLGVTPGVCIAVLGYTKVVSGSERSYEVCPHLGLSRSGDPAANPRAYGRTASSAMTCWFPLFWLRLTKSPLTHRESISPLPLSFHSRTLLLLAFIWNPPPLVSFHLPHAEIQSLSNRPYLWNILLVLDGRKKKRALWLLWTSLRLLAARGDQMRLSRGNIQLLVTLTRLFCRLFSCLHHIFYTQNCRCTNHEGIYLVIIVYITRPGPKVSKAKRDANDASSSCAMGRNNHRSDQAESA